MYEVYNKNVVTIEKSYTISKTTKQKIVETLPLLRYSTWIHGHMGI